MFERLTEIEGKFDSIGERVNDPAVIGDQNVWRALMKEHSALSPIVEAYRAYNKLQNECEENRAMLEETLDDDMRQLVKDEFARNKEDLERLKNELTLLLLPKDVNDDKNVVVEIRGGAGGDEAALFAQSLYRMYARYTERRRWKLELVDYNENDLGGFKEVSFIINGKGAYSRLKYESGVHRVQRVPATESNGRIHTSTVTVAVLPEADEVDAKLDIADCRVDVYRSSGNGGQCVNTTDSAVRITHQPTGIVVSCQDEKSQLKNKEQALKVLRAKLYELETEKQRAAQAAERKSQVGTGDRSEKIRTYNFPQSRVTDHRINMTIYQIESFMDGDIDGVVDSLITTAQAEKIKAISNY